MADDDLMLRKKAERAAQAQALINSDLFVEAFADLRQGYIDAWLNTDARDEAGRQLAWLAVTNLDRVRKHFESVITSGKIALKTLDMIEEVRRPKRAHKANAFDI